ncbi:hypothetical protein TELCIR_08871 [Teladorsagia circumcincta]|uniref:Uncharacterized protein n=1 Tax=Teladorsagia circumcincta TaxID=45464 RepID=A0A2G9UIJ0_TELCI|nr:hypothetical protein TELCIR_08871 [Teladorsagia circumcincta]
MEAVESSSVQLLIESDEESKTMISWELRMVCWLMPLNQVMTKIVKRSLTPYQGWSVRFAFTTDSRFNGVGEFALYQVNVTADYPATKVLFPNAPDEVCPRDQHPTDMVPVIVGSCLAGLIVITMVTYLKRTLPEIEPKNVIGIYRAQIVKNHLICCCYYGRNDKKSFINRRCNHLKAQSTTKLRDYSLKYLLRIGAAVVTRGVFQERSLGNLLTPVNHKPTAREINWRRRRVIPTMVNA